MPTKPVAKKPIPGKPQAVKPAQKNVVQKKPAPDTTKGLPLLKETPQASLVQKKPAPKPAPDKVENLANGNAGVGPEWTGGVIPTRPKRSPLSISRFYHALYTSPDSDASSIAMLEHRSSKKKKIVSDCIQRCLIEGQPPR